MDVDVSPSVPVTTSSTPKPRRRPLPEPIEERVWSSRRTAAKEAVVDAGVVEKSRHLAESGAGTEEKGGGVETRPAPRRFAPQPVETSVKSSRRRFVPEPVETTSSSNRDNKGRDRQTHSVDNDGNEAAAAPSTKPPAHRRFAPVPIESSARSSRDKKDDGASTQRKRRKDDETGGGSREQDGDGSPRSTSSNQSPRSGSGRKFLPELLETAKGSYRHSTIHISSPKHTLQSVPESVHGGHEPAVTATAQVTLVTGESRFSAAALAKRHHEEHRHRSFLVPDLPCIESDSGDDSEAPSLTNSRSSAESEIAKSNQLNQLDKPSGSYVGHYIIKVAAQTVTDQELQEQAMAAYINERPHERIAHYGFDEDDDTLISSPIRVGRLSGEKGVDVRTFRRSSQDDHELEMQSMRNHHEKLEQMKRDFKHDVAGPSRFSAAALATRHHQQEKKNKKVKPCGAGEEDDDFLKMKKAASPPMLGRDLVFPFSISPKMTRCDTDQLPRPRRYESDDDDENNDRNGGGKADSGIWGSVNDGCGQMWNPKVNVQSADTQGLWMGLCHYNDNDDQCRAATPTHSGIQTPAYEASNPFDSAPSRRPGTRSPGCRVGPRLWDAVNYAKPHQAVHLQQESVVNDHFTNSIDSKLLLEKQIDDEFPDSFITQIYNYLSLGYPCLAWSFDEELSKISRISVEELRKDDGLVDARGYVGVSEGLSDCHGNGAASGEAKISCRRWEALRLYVREWARQSPGFRDSSAGGSNITVSPVTKRANGWGGNVAVRKGSWGH
ncbi:hypothetical protein DV735_g5205, partial [Chaetothyriales sp. CBS 134920]